MQNFNKVTFFLRNLIDSMKHFPQAIGVKSRVLIYLKKIK